MFTALQLYSVRDEMEKDYAAGLKKVKELGYDGVELADLYDFTPEQIKKMCDDAGLIPIAAHTPFGDMMCDAQNIFEKYAQIGCKYIVIPHLGGDFLPGNDRFDEFVKTVKEIGSIANSLGMTLLYHNHDFEFVKVDGEYALDLMYAAIPAEFLQTEIDTCWVNVGGPDPAEYILKYTGRSPLVHLKDFVMPGKKPEKMYELMGIEDNIQSGQNEKFEFRPVGYGVQDFDAILKAAQSAGTRWVIVEQDQPSMGKSQIECAAMSIETINRLLTEC